jgi:hypothetical protein
MAEAQPAWWHSRLGRQVILPFGFASLATLGWQALWPRGSDFAFIAGTALGAWTVLSENSEIRWRVSSDSSCAPLCQFGMRVGPIARQPFVQAEGYRPAILAAQAQSRADAVMPLRRGN